MIRRNPRSTRTDTRCPYTTLVRSNSATLAAAHLTDASTPPPGGTFLRDAEGRLNGVLLETAAFIFHGAMPKPTLDQRLATLDAAQHRYFAHGYTHAPDGPTPFGDIAFFPGSDARERLHTYLHLLPPYTVPPHPPT